MAKHNIFIEQEKRYQQRLMRKIEELTPLIYAAFAISLHRRYGFGFNRITTIIADTQQIFNAHVRGEIRVPDALLEETGIDIMSATTARECGANGDAVI